MQTENKRWLAPQSETEETHSFETAAVNTSTASRWIIGGMLALYAALGHFCRVSITVAGSEVFIRDYQISETSMGWVYSTFLIVYTAMMLPGGWLIDRIGSARALTLLGIVMGTFVMVTGVLGWMTSDAYTLWLGLLLVRGLAGIGNAPLHPGAAHAVSVVIDGRHRATVNGMVPAGALVGIALCFPIFGALKDHLGWQMAFVTSGGVLFAYGLAWAAMASVVFPAHVPAARHTESSPIPPVGQSAASMMLRPDLLLVTFSYGAYGYFQYLFFYWMNHYFEKQLHLSDQESRNRTMWILLAQGLGMAVGGMATDVLCRRLGTTWGRRGVVLAGMGFGAAFGLLGVSLEDVQQITISLALSMAALGMCEGVFWTTSTDIGRSRAGLAGAFMNTGGNLGGVISPVLTPWLALKYGWPAAIVVACFVCAVGGAVWLVVRVRPPAHTSTAN
jgi:MFS family permease